jgi:hypothetical protein
VDGARICCWDSGKENEERSGSGVKITLGDDVVAAVGPVAAVFAAGRFVGVAEPLAVMFDPVDDVLLTRIVIYLTAFTPFVDFNLFDLYLHVLGHKDKYNPFK